MQLKKAIESRKCVRKFKTKKPDWRDILECIDLARHAPMAGSNFSIKFILVDDQKSIQKLADAAQQPFVAQAQYVVVVCSRTSRTINLYGERGKTYLRQQAGAVMQNFFLALTEKKLATCWVGHFVEEMIKRELRIPDGVDVEALFPIGYEMGKSKPRKKIEDHRIVDFKVWGNKRMKPVKTIGE